MGGKLSLAAIGRMRKLKKPNWSLEPGTVFLSPATIKVLPQTGVVRRNQLVKPELLIEAGFNVKEKR